MGKVFAIAGVSRTRARRRRVGAGEPRVGQLPLVAGVESVHAQVGDNVSSGWDTYLNGAISDWSRVDCARSDEGLPANGSGSTCCTDERSHRGLQRRLWEHRLARHRADLGDEGQPHHSGDDEDQRHVLRQRAVQHVGVAADGHVPGGRARLRARSPGRELQQSEPGHVHGLHERPVPPRTSTRTRTTTRSSTSSTPISTARAAAGSRATRTSRTARAARSATPRPSRRRAAPTATSTSTQLPGGHRITHVFWAPLG